jgi:hypothetical protein
VDGGAAIFEHELDQSEGSFTRGGGEALFGVGGRAGARSLAGVHQKTFGAGAQVGNGAFGVTAGALASIRAEGVTLAELKGVGTRAMTANATDCSVRCGSE